MAVYALGFMGGDEAAKILRQRLQSDDDRYVRYNAAVALGRRGDMAAKGTLCEMLSSSDLDHLIELAGVTEKQNKIEAIELEALEAVDYSLSSGKLELARALRSQIESLTRSGLVGVRNQAQAVLQKIQPAS